eukprot:CAMPEP_0116064448 /NCGR_PEP_ID=MMETSP0322-20121206/9111_1 /TAXON_ID=163516 /ORGANISM="Leptocylindrus danicus var. apora, Strain B651" /LENGTH=764 /DNA_ID=CAMNT_0003550449 /DNA_START=14 /DNA_END=2308 /DNA_ORIENTATION=-
MNFVTQHRIFIFLLTVANWFNIGFAQLLDSVVFIGDSDIFYWGLQGDSSQTIPGSTNIGVSGATCQSTLNNIDGYLADYQPTLVILKCGTNDMWGGGQVSPEEAYDRFTKVIDRIMLFGAKVIAMSTKPEPPVLAVGHPAMRWQEWNALVEPYVLTLANNAQDDTVSLTYIESFRSLLALGNPPSFWSFDQIHMSAEGYANWNEWVLTAIDSIDNRCVIWENGSCSYYVGDSYVAQPPICFPSNGQGTDPDADEIKCDAPSMFPSLSTANLSGEPTDHPSFALSSVPTNGLTPLSSEEPSQGPTDNHSSSPSHAPSSIPTNGASVAPTLLPTVLHSALSNIPSATPTLFDSSSPSALSAQPSAATSLFKSDGPSVVPTLLPSVLPSALSANPSIEPSNTLSPSGMLLSQTPSISPSLTPSISPSKTPSVSPSKTPSMSPSQTPSMSPSQTPSMSLSQTPSTSPSQTPSKSPSQTPSISPSQTPSNSPSDSPSITPSTNPSDIPSVVPSVDPRLAQTAYVELQLSGLSCDEEISDDVISAIEDAVTDVVETEYIVPGVNVTSFVNTSDCPTASVGDYLFNILVLYIDPTDLSIAGRKLQVGSLEIVSLLNTESDTIITSLSDSGFPIFGTDFTVVVYNAETNGPSSSPSVVPSKMPTKKPSSMPTPLPTSSPSGLPSLTNSALPSLTKYYPPSKTPTALPNEGPIVSTTVSPTSSSSISPTVLPNPSPTASPSISTEDSASIRVMSGNFFALLIVAYSVGIAFEV